MFIFYYSPFSFLRYNNSLTKIDNTENKLNNMSVLKIICVFLLIDKHVK